jgi:hypothetical protein
MLTLQEGHFWGEYDRTDDPFWKGVRTSLVGFFAMGPKYMPQFLGTGFVIGTSEEGFLLVLTAKHVVVDGAIGVQMHNTKRAASAPSILFEPNQPSIEPKSLRAIWMGSVNSDILLVRSVDYTNNLDFALCVLEYQPQYLVSNKLSTTVIALDTRFPEIGEWVNVVALTDFIFDGTSEGDGSGIWQIGTRAVVRVGKVLSREVGALGHSGPCFRTTIPVDRGMSGGFAYIPRDGQAVAACGILSSGPKEDDKQSSFQVCGNSAFGGTLGTLGLKLPAEICGGQPFTLLDLVKAGQIIDVGGGATNVEIVDGGGDGSYEVVKRIPYTSL